MAVDIGTGVTGAGDSGTGRIRAQTGSSALLARAEAEASTARNPVTEFFGMKATRDTRMSGEVQRARRRTSAESGSEMGRETRKAEARTAKGRKTGRRTAGVDSQGRLREVGG